MLENQAIESMPSITTLPQEVVDLICNYLEPHDWFALRLSCKTLSAKTFDLFTRSYFNSLNVLITSASLAILANIAAHDVFRNRVYELWITPALFEGEYDVSFEHFEHWIQNYERRSGYRPQISRPINPPDKAIEARYLAYKVAVADHLGCATSDAFSIILERSIACFPNLGAVGLRQYNLAKRVRGQEPRLECFGWRKLKDRLGCDPTIAWKYPLSPPGPGVPNIRALTFSALLKAIGSSGRVIERLDTCGGCCSGLILADFKLTQAQCDSVLSILQELKDLHLCIRTWWGQPEDATYEFLLDILSTAAPSLETLTFSQSAVGGEEELAVRHFEWLSLHVHFSRLSKLEFRSIETALPALIRFLSTAAPTLKTMQFGTVSLTSNNTSSINSTEFKEEGKRLWQQVWDFFRDELSLQWLSFTHIRYRGRPVLLVDRLHGLGGSNQLTHCSSHALYIAERANVGFKEWVDQLRFQEE